MPAGRRWGVAVLLGLGVLVTYLDRVNISLGTDTLTRRFDLDEASLGLVLTAAMTSYKLLQIPAGLILDRFGVRPVMLWSILAWALATLATSLAPSLTWLLLARLALGAAEAPVFPACAKAVGSWFPRQERSLATAFFDASAKLAMVVGPPLVALMLTRWGWQAGFQACAGVTLMYGLAFWLLYEEPPGKQRRSPAMAGSPVGAGVGPYPNGEAAHLGDLLRQPGLWGLMVGFGGYGYGLYMLITWLPAYLQHELHLSVLQSGLYVSIPWGVATFTDLVVGGWLVDRLIRAGHGSARVRRGLIALGMGLGMTLVGAAHCTDPRWAVGWISVSLGGLAMVSPIAWSLPGLLAPGAVGRVASLANTASNLMGLTAGVLTGYLVRRQHSFALAFTMVGLALALGILGFTQLLGWMERREASQGLS